MTPADVGRVGGLVPLPGGGAREARRRPVPPGAGSGFALRYSNGVDIVEISHAALRRFIDATGAIPLPVTFDSQTGDRRVYDAANSVAAVYDADGALRNVTSRRTDGSVVHITFPSREG